MSFVNGYVPILWVRVKFSAYRSICKTKKFKSRFLKECEYLRGLNLLLCRWHLWPPRNLMPCRISVVSDLQLMGKNPNSLWLTFRNTKACFLLIFILSLRWGAGVLGKGRRKPLHLFEEINITVCWKQSYNAYSSADKKKKKKSIKNKKYLIFPL